jgi:MFS family permease
VTALLRLARQSPWRRWTLASFLARLPGTMTLLALVLAGEQVTGSLAIGAQLSGVAIGTGGFAALWRGRRLDRIELRGGLQRDCVATGVVLAAQTVAVGVSAPLIVLFALAAVQGLTSAAVYGGYRALLPAVVHADDVPAANGLDAVFVEVAFVSGPVLAGVLGLVTGSVGVLAAMAVAYMAAALVATGLPRYAPVPPVGAIAPLRVPLARVVYALGLVLGATLGIFESAVPARLPQLGLAPAIAGPLLALTALGSAIGGIVASGRADPLGHQARRSALLLAAFGLLVVPTALSGSAAMLGLALFGAGFPIAPLNALGALVLSACIPAGRQAEGFAILTAAILIGAGLGQIAAGRLLPVLGPQGLLALAATLPFVLAVTVAIASAHRVQKRRYSGASAHRVQNRRHERG